MCKNFDSGKGIYGNVMFDYVFPSPGEVYKNTETEKNNKSEKQL